MKQPLALLPGLLCDAALWEPQLSELADVARFWVPDLTEYETMKEMGESVLRDAPWKEFALAGLSMGGYVALLSLASNFALLNTGCSGGGEARSTALVPNITSLNPTSAVAGTSVTITGTNFGASQGNSTVSFNGTAATPTSWNATSIVVAVPAGATTGNVVVTVGGAASNGMAFTVTSASGSAPSITSLSPTSGPVGTSVTIAGANFGASQGSSTVSFNGTAATPTSWNATSLVVAVPAGATTGNVVLTVGGAASNGVTFTVSSTTGGKFPITTSANGRYFVDATGAPWLMVGD